MTQTKYILLADDNENDVQLIMLSLGQLSRSHKVAVAHDGAEALDYLYRRGGFKSRETGQPLAILLDLKMPKVDGLEVLRQIKADHDLKMIPVIVLTSSREESDIVKSYRLGANAYVVKPVNFEEFREAIKETEVFWTFRNEPPPETAISSNSVPAKENVASPIPTCRPQLQSQTH